jgi:hypothetical protein
VISGRLIFSGHGSSSKSASSTSSSQVSTPCVGGHLETFTMEGQYPTIRLLEFLWDGSYDLEKKLFICENIWEENKITGEDTKVAQLEITFRDRTLD